MREPARDQSQVERHRRADTRSEQLEGHVAFRTQAPPVDARHAPARHGGLIDVLEHIVQHGAEGSVERLTGRGTVERSAGLLKRRQLLARHGRQQITTGGHDLPRLNEGRAEQLEQPGDPSPGVTLTGCSPPEHPDEYGARYGGDDHDHDHDYESRCPQHHLRPSAG